MYIIYVITDCPECLRAQADLMQRGVEYAFVETDFSPSYRKALKVEFGWSTFPMIVKVSGDEEEFVGGYEDLRYILKKESGGPD